jgi:hypothetical protein
VSNPIGKNVEKYFTVTMNMNEPPKLVYKKGEKLIASIGQTSPILDCRLVDQTNVKISWKKNEIRISDKSKFNWESNYQIMSIPNILNTDEGRYKCEAENSAGKIFKEFFLTVEDINIIIKITDF